MKYRTNSKIKHQHNMIPRLRELLESIESWPEIKVIIPGAIKPTHGASRGKLKLEVKYDTSTGIKCLAYSGSGIQEVFITTNDPSVLTSKIKELK
jgi:hypothetical protein